MDRSPWWHSALIYTAAALGAVAALVMLASEVRAATYSVGDACADVVTNQGALIREFRKGYPRPAATGGMIALSSLGISASGLVSFVEVNPNGSTSSYSVQLQACTTDRCVPNGITVAPCPYGYAPYSAASSGVMPGMVADNLYPQVFAAVSPQDVAVAAVIGVAFVLGLMRGVAR